MLLLIGVALARTRSASRGLATATGANGGTLLRLPVYEDASVFDADFCFHNLLTIGICLAHCTPSRCASCCVAHAQKSSARPLTTADVDHSTNDRPIIVTDQFLQAVCMDKLFSTCPTSRAAPFSVIDHAERHFEDHFRPLPAHRFAHAQVTPSQTTQGAPDMLSEESVLIFFTLARIPVHEYIDVTRQPPRETHFDVRYRQLQRRDFTCTQTTLSTVPHPAPSTPTYVSQQCSSSSRDDARRHDDKAHAPWSVTHFVAPRRLQPAHGLMIGPSDSSGTPWGVSDKLLQYSGTPSSPSSDNETHGRDGTTTHRSPAEERYDEQGHRPLFLVSSYGRAASTHASHPVPHKAQGTPSQAQGTTKTPVSFSASRIAWTGYVRHFLLPAGFELLARSRARHFLPSRPMHVIMVFLSSLQAVASTPSKSAQSVDEYQSPEAPNRTDSPETPQATTTPFATDPEEQISLTGDVPPDGLPDPARPSSSGIDTIEAVIIPTQEGAFAECHRIEADFMNAYPRRYKSLYASASCLTARDNDPPSFGPPRERTTPRHAPRTSGLVQRVTTGLGDLSWTQTQRMTFNTSEIP